MPESGGPATLWDGNLEMNLLASVETLLAVHGGRPALAMASTGVTALEPALQCARLAERDGSSDALVAAALLHDLGRLVGPVGGESEDDDHDLRTVAWLAPHLGVDVIEPIRLHVTAKRYLAATSPRYLASLAPEALRQLERQGGRLSSYEAWMFGAQPYAEQALALRRWDDLAHRPGLQTPGLRHYLPLLESLRDRPIIDVVE